MSTRTIPIPMISSLSGPGVVRQPSPIFVRSVEGRRDLDLQIEDGLARVEHLPVQALEQRPEVRNDSGDQLTDLLGHGGPVDWQPTSR